MVKGFSKMYNFSFFGQIFFCKHFYYITGFCDKKFNFCKFAIFFADFKSRAQELSNKCIICHIWTSNMGFRGGGVKLTPPSISWFSSTPAEIGLRVNLEPIFGSTYDSLSYVIDSCQPLDSTYRDRPDLDLQR